MRLWFTCRWKNCRQCVESKMLMRCWIWAIPLRQTISRRPVALRGQALPPNTLRPNSTRVLTWLHCSHLSVGAGVGHARAEFPGEVSASLRAPTSCCYHLMEVFLGWKHSNAHFWPDLCPPCEELTASSETCKWIWWGYFVAGKSYGKGERTNKAKEKEM